MIANFFSKTKPINFLVLSVLSFLIYFFGNVIVPLGDITFSLLLKKAVFLILIILSVFIINFILRKNILTDDNSFALLIYILLFGIFPQALSDEKIIVSNFILLFAFRRIYSLRTPIKPKEKIFDSAFWIGLSGLIYFWSFIFIFLVYSSVRFFKKQSWRNFVIPVVGIIIPIFLYGVYLSLYNDYSLLNIFDSFKIDFNYEIYKNKIFLIPIIVVIIIAIISIFPTTQKFLSAKIDFKLTWFVLMSHLLLTVFMIIIIPEKNGKELSFVFFPLSIVIANYIQIVKKYWIKELIIYVFIILFVLSILWRV